MMSSDLLMSSDLPSAAALAPSRPATVASQRFASMSATRIFSALICAALIFAALGFVSSPAFAQDGRTFGDAIDVRVINLEVVVTEKGVRKTGLRPEDFQLTVDGEEVAIEYFTEVHGGAAVVRDDADDGTVPALIPGEPVSTSYLVFIDEFFNVKPERNRVLDRMIEQLSVLQPQDRMAVVAYDGEKLDMLTSWSQSKPELERVLRDAKERPANGLRRDARIRSLLPNRELFGTANLPADVVAENDTNLALSLDAEEEHLIDIIEEHVGRVVMASSSALRGFANPPGRKVMLMLAGDWPFHPAQWVVGDAQRAVFTGRSQYGDQLYDPLFTTANRLSYTLYPVGVEPFATPIAGAEVGGSRTDESIRRSFDRQQDERTALYMIADSTGGKALLGGAGADVLQRVSDDTRSYYWIGFTPRWQGDDSSHKVKVDVRGKGLKVRSRGSYSDLSRETEVTMMVESSLFLGDPPSSLPLGVEMAAAMKSKRGKLLVPVRIAIPLGAITFLPVAEGFRAETELRIAVLDEQGATAEVPVIPLNFTVPEVPPEGAMALHETAIEIRKRKHDLVFAVYDVASGAILTEKTTFDPESAEMAEPVKRKRKRKE